MSFSLSKFPQKSIPLLASIASLGLWILGLGMEKKALQFIPFIVIFGLLFWMLPRFFFFLTIASLPLTVAVDFSRSLSTDFPFEFLAMGLTAIAWTKLLLNPKESDWEWINKPIFWWILLLWGWSIICSIAAKNPVIAWKYTAAKVWYISVFYILSYQYIQREKDLKTFFWAFFWPFMFTVVYSFARTALGNFNFEFTNYYSEPFYPNHVLYATTLSIFLPFVWFAREWYRPGTLARFLLNSSILLILLAIYFSYTRSCYIAIVVALAYAYVIRWRISAYFFLGAMILVAAAIYFLSLEYEFLKLQPDFTKTIMHDSFKDHIYATFKGQDASSMERLNMWIGVLRMSPENPILGVGPNNFPFTYKPFTLYHFHTWVSDNTANLSCHNYFLLMLAEQGWPALIIFIATVYYFLWKIDKLYADATTLYQKKWFVCIGSSFVILLINLYFSDLIETAKNGFFFFFLAAMIAHGFQILKK